MQRDWDLFRGILLKIADEEKTVLRYRDFGKLLSDAEQHHLRLLIDASYLRVISEDWNQAWVGPTAPAVRPTRDYFIEITGAGHDYLDAVRDNGLWEKTKAAVADTGGNVTVEIVRSLAVGFLKKKIQQHTGIDV